MKNSNNTIGNRTRDLPACSAVPQPTAAPRAHLLCLELCINKEGIWIAQSVQLPATGSTVRGSNPGNSEISRTHPDRHWSPRGRGVTLTTHPPTCGLRPLDCWNFGFEPRRGHGYLSLVSFYVLSSRGPCDGPITHPKESYRMWCVWVWS